MLKIKDNIDMEILSKYGFKRYEYIGDIDTNKWFTTNWIDENGNYCDAPPLDRSKIDWTYWANNDSWINEKDLSGGTREREIFKEDFDLDILYELIQDGLIEKV